MFLYIDPLKQGLKQYKKIGIGQPTQNVFIHRSIKTRIETAFRLVEYEDYKVFLYIDPLKQGLKHSISYRKYSGNKCFYT